MRKKCIPCSTPATPYYKDKNNSLTQDHAAIFNDTQYAAGVLIVDEFVIPALGEDIQVEAKNLVNLEVVYPFWFLHEPSISYHFC